MRATTTTTADFDARENLRVGWPVPGPPTARRRSGDLMFLFFSVGRLKFPKVFRSPFPILPNGKNRAFGAREPCRTSLQRTEARAFGELRLATRKRSYTIIHHLCSGSSPLLPLLFFVVRAARGDHRHGKVSGHQEREEETTAEDRQREEAGQAGEEKRLIEPGRARRFRPGAILPLSPSNNPRAPLGGLLPLRNSRDHPIRCRPAISQARWDGS